MEEVNKKSFFTLYAISQEGKVFPIAAFIEKEVNVFHLHPFIEHEELVKNGLIKAGQEIDSEWYFLMQPNWETIRDEGFPFNVVSKDGKPFDMFNIRSVKQPIGYSKTNRL